MRRKTPRSFCTVLSSRPFGGDEERAQARRESPLKIASPRTYAVAFGSGRSLGESVPTNTTSASSSAVTALLTGSEVTIELTGSEVTA